MNGSRKIIALALLCSLALGLRVRAVATHSADRAISAENLPDGQDFATTGLDTTRLDATGSPFYRLLLAAADWCFGAATPGAVLAVAWLQCLVGTLLVAAVAWLAWSLLPELPCVGWLAAVGTAVYPPYLERVAELHVAPWAALVLTLLLALTAAPRWRARRFGAVVAGCLAGTLV
ncbi:hypothetical protein LCGC14_2820320, partial [marine sediment metagenome]